MRTWRRVGLVWWIFGVACLAVAENQGGTEAEVRQGTLSRWSAWWAPAPGTEGRMWWEPEGGAAWLRVGEFQVGPLQEVPGAEGTVTWGPSVRQSGTWGAAWSGPLAGAWAFQKTDSFEAGFQGKSHYGTASWGAGASRTWGLGVADGGPRWTDRGFAGGTWGGTGWKTGAEFRTSREEEGEFHSVLAGRVSVGDGPWELEGKGMASGPQSWSARVKGRWEEPGWGLEGTWDREGTAVRATAEARVWTLLGGTEGELRWTEGRWSGRAGAAVSGPVDRGRWKLGGTVVPDGERTVQKAEVSWKEPGLEASVDWAVEGRRLGWFGPGSRLTWKLRWFF